MGKVQRAFLNEYGLEVFEAWRKSRLPLAEYEKTLYIPVEGYISEQYKDELDGR